MEHFFAQVNGIRLHCVAEGRADAPLMLFIHGFPEFWYCWHRQLEAFGRDHRAVAFDLRGHNLSDKPEGVAAYRPKVLVEDLRQLVEHLQADRCDKSCILVAHDWGGAIAWTFAAAWSQPGALTCALNLYRASPLYPPTPEDPGAAALKLDPAALTVRVPTLVIWGEADTALGATLLDGLEEVVPDLRVRRIPEGSHWVIHEQPQQVSAAIREFLKEA